MTRIDTFEATPSAMKILIDQENYLKGQFSDSHPITVAIWELVKLLVSQINQCGFCLNMHFSDAVKLGETPERIVGLNAWRDMPFYSEAERQALAWAELIVSDQPVQRHDYEQVLKFFGEKGIVELTIAINAINSWNHLSKAFKPEIVYRDSA